MRREDDARVGLELREDVEATVGDRLFADAIATVAQE
jgi:hypothetical protein